MIGDLDGIVDIERRRDRLADGFAALDIHGSVRLLGHDLQRQPALPRKANANEAEADRAKDGLNDQGDAGVDAGLADDAVVACLFDCVFGHRISRRSAGNKKERDRVDPLFVIPTKNLRLI
jgi:hypothetical protein